MLLEVLIMSEISENAQHQCSLKGFEFSHHISAVCTRGRNKCFHASLLSQKQFDQAYRRPQRRPSVYQYSEAYSPPPQGWDPLPLWAEGPLRASSCSLIRLGPTNRLLPSSVLTLTVYG